MINMQPTAPRCANPYAAPVPAQMARSTGSATVRAGAGAGGQGGSRNGSAPNGRNAPGGWNGTDTALAPYAAEQTYAAEEADGLTSMPQDDFDSHMTADEAARSSWRALLARNVGRNVIVSFLLGTQNTVVAEGELYEVGSDYLVIYQPAWDSHITADLYAVKFVEFREPPRQDP